MINHMTYRNKLWSELLIFPLLTTEPMWHRQRFTKRGDETNLAEKSIILETFVIRKEYLKKYKKYHPEMKKSELFI